MIVSIISWLKEAAEKKLSAGDIGQGLWYYEKLLNIGRNDKSTVAYAHAKTGEVMLAVGEVHQAKVHLLEALKNRPAEPHCLFLLSCLYASTNNWEKAREFARKAHILVPDSAEYLRALGWAVLCSGDLREGVKTLRRAVKLEPTSVDAIGDLGAGLLEQRRFDEAVELLSQAVTEHPKDKRLRKMLDFAKKFRAPAQDRVMVAPKLSERYAVVEDLLRKRMPEEGFHSEQVDSAVQLWRDYTRNTEPRFHAPGSWAAAIEYAMSKLEKETHVTQKALASKYGVSATSISSKYRQIWSALGKEREAGNHSSRPGWRSDTLMKEYSPTDNE